MRFHFKTGYDSDIDLFPDWGKRGLYLALLALAVALPWLLDDFFLGEATNVLIWAVAGLGLMLLTGQTGQVSLGHSAFMALGCYLCVLMMEAGLPFLAAFLLAGVLTGIVGALVAIPALRLHGVYLAIATLALAILADDIVVLLAPWTGGVNGKYAPPITILGQAVERLIGNVLGGLEHQVFEQVCKSRTARGVILAADAIPDLHRHIGRGRIVAGIDLHAVVQHATLIAEWRNGYA